MKTLEQFRTIRLNMAVVTEMMFLKYGDEAKFDFRDILAFILENWNEILMLIELLTKDER